MVVQQKTAVYAADIPGQDRAEKDPRGLTPAATAMWSQMLDEVLRVCGVGGLGNHEVACMAGTTLAFDLGSKDPGIQNYAKYAIGNTVPAWDPEYSKHNQVAQAYQLFINSIDPAKCGAQVNPNLADLINRAMIEYNAASDNFHTVSRKAVAEYIEFTKAMHDDKMTYADYIRQYNPTVNRAQEAMLGAQHRWQSLMRQAHGFGYEAIAQASNTMIAALNDNMPSNMNMKVTSGSVAAEGSSPVLPGATPPARESDLAHFYRPRYDLPGFADIYREWQDKSARNEPGHMFEAKANASAVSWQRFGWSGEAQATFGGSFVNVEVGATAEGKSHTVRIDSTDAKLTLSFTALGQFDIAREPWFNLSLIQDFAEATADAAGQFFGKNGSFSLLPTRAILGFEPGIELHLSEKSYSHAKSQWEARGEAALNIGPFRFGGPGFAMTDKRENVKWTDEARSITVPTVKSRLPLLLGVICTKLGPKRQAPPE
jgi:hypothetical protein